MQKLIQEQILSDLTALLRNFNNREYSGPIGLETYFFADLAMASIDAVLLGEILEQYYEQKFPFHAFLAKHRTTGARDLKISELIEFLKQHMNK
jgi:acyl carrier protein